jgi:hypothetical protein
MTSHRFVSAAALLVVAAPVVRAASVQVTPKEAERRVDVTVDDKPFTSYVWPTTLKKPVLNPLRTASGKVLTRGFPLDPRPGERTDHPHHVGLWFNYGNVNGADFWNNSDANPNTAKMGTIAHLKIESAKGGDGKGELVVDDEWRLPGDKPLVAERTRFVFRAGGQERSIDRLTTLRALAERVVFNDDKEGLIGIRVVRSLEHPSKEPLLLTDASGLPTKVPVLDNSGVTGHYLSSEGKQGDDVWGTRGRWVALGGTVEGEAVTLLLLDHPKNPGAPTYWHARGYGLFAANPLGQKIFSQAKEELKFAIEPGKSAEFRYRIVIVPGLPKAEAMEAQYKRFVREVE